MSWRDVRIGSALSLLLINLAVLAYLVWLLRRKKSNRGDAEHSSLSPLIRLSR